MRIVCAVLLAGVMVLVSTVAARQATVPDIVIVNGRVFTGEASGKWAQAVAIAGDRIVAVGDTAAIRASAGSATRVIDAGGRLVIPGINDAHTHPGAMPAHTTLEGPPAIQHDPTLGEVIGRIKAAVAKAPAGEWVLGEIGATVLFDPKATRTTLDAVSGDHPVMLVAWSGHGTIFNTAALRALKVGETEPDPPGGRFGRMPDGRTLDGRASEYAEYILRQRLSMMPDGAAQQRAYEQFAREVTSFGITSVQAMMTSYDAGRSMALFEGAKLPLRVRVIDFPMSAPSKWSGAAVAPRSPMLARSGVKYIVDGTPIERLMYLRAPFSDAPQARGRLNFEAGEYLTFLPRAFAAGVQPMFHAVGDAAIDTVLDALEATGGETWARLRPRLEHGDMLEPSHFERAKRMGVILVQNPSHFTIPEIMQARLGDRHTRTHMIKSTLTAGVPFAIGSDGPLNPFLNIMFATMTPTNPPEAITVEDALMAYTRGSAFAEFKEGEKGTLAKGKLADLAILSQDIFSVPPPELPKTVSVLTMVGGRVVYEAKQ